MLRLFAIDWFPICYILFNSTYDFSVDLEVDSGGFRFWLFHKQNLIFILFYRNNEKHSFVGDLLF